MRASFESPSSRGVVLFALVLLGACIDFDAAREQCKTSGNCLVPEAPTLVSTVPAKQAVNVDIDTPLTITFSKAMSHEVQISVSPPVPLGASTWDQDDTTWTVLPNLPFSYSKTYTVVLSGQATDGTRLGADTSFAFTTRPEPDKMAPQWNTNDPTDNKTGVAVDAPISLYFNEAMNTGFFELASEPEFDLGEPSWSPDNTSVTYSAHEDLQGNTPYQLTLIKAQDLSQNDVTNKHSFSFITGASPDTTPPIVVSTSPPADSVEVDVGVTPSVSFSEPMSTGSATTIHLLYGDGGLPDAGCVPVFDPSLTLLTCTHAASPLRVNTPYVVVIDSSASDATGNAMDSGFEFRFTTGSVPDNTRPTIVSTFPDAGATGVYRASSIKVTFSEPMDKFSVEGALQFSPSVAGTYSWDGAGKVVTFNPNADFTDFQHVTWQVNAAAKDLANNTLLSTQAFSFYTAKVATLAIPAFAAETGYISRRLTPSSLYTWYLNAYQFAGQGAGSSSYHYRGIMTFNINALPTSALRIRTASLDAYQAGAVGTAGSVYADKVHFAAGPTGSATTAFSVAAENACPPIKLCFRASLTSSNTVGPRSVGVTNEVQSCLNEYRADGGYRCQFRLDSTKDDSPVPSTDYQYFRNASVSVPDGGPRLLVQYETP